VELGLSGVARREWEDWRRERGYGRIRDEWIGEDDVELILNIAIYFI